MNERLLDAEAKRFIETVAKLFPSAVVDWSRYGESVDVSDPAVECRREGDYIAHYTADEDTGKVFIHLVGKKWND